MAAFATRRLRRGLPVGFVWGEEEGEVCFHPDEAVCTAIRQVFAQFAETGSARRVWLWFRSEGLKFPLQMHQGGEIRWVEASYTAIHQVLTNPVYAGAYVYGRTRHEIVLDATGGRKKRVRHLPRAEWQVLIPEHHPGFIDWQTYEANQERIARNSRPGPHQAGGAVREGGRAPARAGPLWSLRSPSAHPLSWSQRLARLPLPRQGSRREPWRLLPQYRRYPDRRGRHSDLRRCPGAGWACRHPCAAERLEAEREVALKHWRLGVERANYEAQRAERRYRAVDPDNRLVARGLERDWRSACADLRRPRSSWNAAKKRGRG